MDSHQYDQYRADKLQRATEDMIRMREPRSTGLPRRVTVETADGFVVIASKIATGSVVPPYKHTYWHEWCASLEAAEDHYADLEKGEHSGWRPDAIVPCFAGLPRAEMKLRVS